MLRRCLQANPRQFGMVPPPRTTATTGHEYGTMLEIRNVQMLPDGRSVVETWGAWRFRIVERGTLDGYAVARVERVDDWPEDAEQPDRAAAPAAVSDSATPATVPESAAPAAVRGRGRDPAALPTNAELMAKCHAFLRELRDGTPWVVHQLSTAYVPMPQDLATFSFWMGAVSGLSLPLRAQRRPGR